MNEKEDAQLSETKNEDKKRKADSIQTQVINKNMKKLIILALKPLIIIILIICVVAVVISSTLHYINIYDGTYQEGDLSNLPFVVDYSLENMQIDSNGNITTGMSAQEIWDTIIENGGRINHYLSSAEELKKIINAELITQYVDTRQNPDEPIDWDAINNDPNSTQIQGIIKLKRESSDGEESSTMTYTDPETFQSYIDKYNETGSEEDQKTALGCFTIEIENQQVVQESTSQNTKLASLGVTYVSQELIKTFDIQGYGGKYDYFPWQCIGEEDSKQQELKEQAGMNFDEEGFGKINGRYAVAVSSLYGNIGDYIDYYYKDNNGDEQIIPCIIVDNREDNRIWENNGNTTVLGFCVDEVSWTTSEWKHPYENHVSIGQAEKMHPEIGTEECHKEWQGLAVKIVTGSNYFDNPNYISDKIVGTNENNGGNTGNNGSSSGNNGSSGNNKNNTVNENNIGSTGNNTNSENNNINDDLENDSQTEEEEIEQNMPVSQQVGYVRVAAWKEARYILETDDPDVETYDETEYMMDSTRVNYQDLVSGFSMPFEFLLSYLIVGQEKDFVLDVADLVYDSEINISILDSLTVDTIEVMDTYTKNIKVETDATINASYTTNVYTTKKVNGEWKSILTDTVPHSYSKTQENMTGFVDEQHWQKRTVIIKTNTIGLVLSKADTWSSDYERDVSVNEDKIETEPENSEGLEDEEISSTPNKEDKIDYVGLAENFRSAEEQSIQANPNNTNISVSISNIDSRYYFGYSNKNRECDETIELKNYILEPATITEKLDPNSDTPNFITIFRDIEHDKNAINIKSASTWLYEILANNEETADMVDLSKYLQQIAQDDEGTRAGFDLDIFDFEKTIDNDDTDNDNNSNIMQGTEGLTDAERVLIAAAAIHEHEIDWTYSNDHIWQFINDVEASLNSKDKSLSCATYVVQVLYLSGMLSAEEINVMNQPNNGTGTSDSWQSPRRSKALCQ